MGDTLSKNKLNKGALITFEGIDGSGKSTQIKKLKNYLKKKKIKNFYFTREPGGSDFGNISRKLLLNNNKIKFSSESQILLLVASRFEHHKQFILPLLKKNKIVVSDRFKDSTYAYQCGNNERLYNLLRHLNSLLFDDFEPYLTILLDISPKIAVQRMKNREANNAFDKKTLYFYKIARNNYLKLAKNNKRIIVFNASLDQDELFNNIQKVIFKKIKQNAIKF